MKPLITTIIPTYQRPDRLKKAIQSVLNQTYPHFQVCVYDNASGDETAAVVAELARLDPRVKYHCHESNIGAVENFQHGLVHIETPFFSFLSDDDFLLPEFYETALKGFERYPDAASSSGLVIDVNDSGEVLGETLLKWPDREYYPSPEGLVEMVGKYSNWIGTLFRKELIEKIGLLDLSLKAIDFDYAMRAAGYAPLVISKKPCAVFVQHSNSYSKKYGFKLAWPGWKIILSKVKEHPLISPEVKRIVEQKLQADLGRLLLRNIVGAVKQKDFDLAATIAQVFNENCDQKFVKWMLWVLITGCRVFPCFNSLLKLLLKIRKLKARLIPCYKMHERTMKE